MPFKPNKGQKRPGTNAAPAGKTVHRRADVPVPARPTPAVEVQRLAPPESPAPTRAAQPPAAAPPERKAAPASKKPSQKRAAARPPRAQNPVAAAIGQFFYTLGFSAEYLFVQVWRVLREAGLLIGQLVAWLATRLGRAILSGLRGIGRELASPFVRFRRRRRQIHRIRTRENRRRRAGRATGRRFVGASFTHTMAFVANVVGIVLPIAAAAVLVVIISAVINLQYALVVKVNDNLLGYVSDQNVVESAKGLLRGRIKLASNQELSDWQFNPEYSIGTTTRFTTAQQLTDEILRKAIGSEVDLMEATGLYIDGELYAATTEGERLKEYLDDKLESYQTAAGTGAQTSYVKEVVCDPDLDEVFFASGVK
ncbi:MAG: hypothetical protein AB7V55_07445, partial [Oscillospiraceae bacterium]